MNCLTLRGKGLWGSYQRADRWGFRRSQFKSLLHRAGSAVKPDRLIRTTSAQSCKPQRIQSALSLSRKPVTLLDCHYREKSFPYTWYKHLVSAYAQCFSLSYRQAFPQPPLTGQVLQPLTAVGMNLANSLICPGERAELDTVPDVAQRLLSRDSLPMTSAAQIKEFSWLSPKHYIFS